MTPCSAKYASVSAASVRILSSSSTSALGVRSLGGPSPLSGRAEQASSTTRRPACACSSTRAPTRASRSGSWACAIGSSTSGAPRNHEPWSANCTALHLRTDANGIAPVACHPGGAGKASRNANAVAFGDGSAAASAPSASCTASAPSPMVSTDCTAMAPSVSVPVLSRHSTSTRASPSTAGSSCTSTLTRPRRTTPAAKATLVRRTSPSGTIATTPPTDVRNASDTLSAAWSWLTSSRIAVGTIAYEAYLMIVSMPARSSERTSVKRRASSASATAYASRPTFVA